MADKPPKKQNRGTFIKGLLRRGSFHWKARNEAFKMARVERGKYKCAMCGELFGPKEVNMDHIHPVVDPRTGFTTWDEYIERLYPYEEGWQCLCSSCHDGKTRIEDSLREHYKTEAEKLPDLTGKKKRSRKKKIDKPIPEDVE
jgi:5-methylcytosine-specific restriction endonuclease McrA